MTSQQFKDIQKKMGVTNRKMAETLGHPLRTIDHWRAGTRPIPGAVVKLLECLEKQSVKK